VLLLFAGASAARETSEPQVPSESGDSEEQGKDERGAEERERSEEDMEDAAGGQKSEEDAPLGEDLREVSIDDFDVPDEARWVVHTDVRRLERAVQA